MVCGPMPSGRARPSATAHDRIEVPTLILSCEDDLFGTADTARRLADRIPGAALKIWPDGGHIWLGHDDDVAREIALHRAAGPLPTIDPIAGGARMTWKKIVLTAFGGPDVLEVQTVEALARAASRARCASASS